MMKKAETTWIKAMRTEGATEMCISMASCLPRSGRKKHGSTILIFQEKFSINTKFSTLIGYSKHYSDAKLDRRI